jgi:hypothetical protein
MNGDLTHHVKRGDTAPEFRVRVLDGTTPINLASAQEVRLAIVDPRDPSALLVDAVMTVDDQDDFTGRVSYGWDPDDLSIAGIYRGDIKVSWPDGTTQTFPSDGYIRFVVLEDVAL